MSRLDGKAARSGARRWIMRQASTRFIGFSAGLWPIARRYQSGSDTQRARPSGVNHALDSFAIRCTTDEHPLGGKPKVTMYGGSWGWLEPSFSYGGRSGALDYFVTGDFLHNNRGIENPTSSFNAIHDTTNQLHGLADLSYIIDPETRVSLILGGFDGQFQIPNNPGQTTLGFRSSASPTSTAPT